MLFTFRSSVFTTFSGRPNKGSAKSRPRHRYREGEVHVHRIGLARRRCQRRGREGHGAQEAADLKPRLPHASAWSPDPRNPKHSTIKPFEEALEHGKSCGFILS